MDCPFFHAMKATPKNVKERYNTFFLLRNWHLLKRIRPIASNYNKMKKVMFCKIKTVLWVSKIIARSN